MMSVERLFRIEQGEKKVPCPNGGERKVKVHF
jgi:hypothetical protein